MLSDIGQRLRAQNLFDGVDFCFIGCLIFIIYTTFKTLPFHYQGHWI